MRLMRHTAIYGLMCSTTSIHREPKKTCNQTFIHIRRKILTDFYDIERQHSLLFLLCRLQSAVLATVAMSVRLSVCLAHASTVSKLLKLL